jgi:hypothetical protein
MVVMVMMVMVVVTAVRHHDDRSVTAIAVVVMVVMMMMILHELDIFIRRRDRCRFIDSLQEFSRVRNRLEELGEGVSPQDV